MKNFFRTQNDKKLLLKNIKLNETIFVPKYLTMYLYSCSIIL